MQCQKLKTYMETGRVVFLPARSIRPNPAQPRKIFRPEALDELSDSIRQHGILQPLSVRRSGNGYELIAGERRLRAAELAGITDIPCIIMSMDDRESGMAAMVENLQRQDLDFIEEAMGISRLLEDWNMSQEQAARLLGKSQSAVANKLRLLKHSEPVLLALREAGLTERHARALLRLTDPEQQLAAALVGQLRPAAVVCVDSLCSAEGQRLGRTVQFSDSGLYPAQADHTRHLTRDTLGVPVVAAGIPTLMQAQEGADLVVTPRALDSVIAHGAALLAGSVNRALQPRLTVQQLCWLTG